MSIASIRRKFKALRVVPSQVATAFASWINVKLQENHDAGVNPYGVPWAELRPATLLRGRTPPPLDDTGAMRSTARAYPTAGAGVAVEYTDPKARWAQDGDDNRAAREVLPDDMPAEWSEALQEIKRAKVGAA